MNADAISHEDYLNAPGESFSLTFDTPGTYGYYCEPHQGAGMAGECTAAAGWAAAPATAQLGGGQPQHWVLGAGGKVLEGSATQHGWLGWLAKRATPSCAAVVVQPGGCPALIRAPWCPPPPTAAAAGSITVN